MSVTAETRIARHACHVCLVSQQATPNFIPVLDKRFRPQRVILVVSPDMRERASWLQTALVQKGIAVTLYDIDDPWNVQRLQDQLLELLVKEAATDLALNVTGGTKPMAIAAQEVFRAEDKPVFYVHPERGEVIPLFREAQPFHIQESVQIPDYLGIHGYHERSRDTREFSEECYTLARDWIKEVERFARPLARLNGLAQDCKKTLCVAVPDHAREPHVWEMIDTLREHGLARVNGSQLVFPDEESRFFVNGGWLELHVAGVVQGLNGLQVQDSARSLKVESPEHARNELDVAVLARNRLFLIECKTKGMKERAGAAPGADALYKIDSLTALGGLNTRAMIVSYQPLETQDKQRARDLKIDIIEGGELRNLRRHLESSITRN